MGYRTHRGQRSVESREFRKARSYCFENSWYDPKLQERVFVGSPEGVVAAVNLAFGVSAVPEEIPDTPKGLVLADNRCRGAFQCLAEA